MPTFEIQDPRGGILEIESDTFPDSSSLDEIFRASAPFPDIEELRAKAAASEERAKKSRASFEEEIAAKERKQRARHVAAAMFPLNPLGRMVAEPVLRAGGLKTDIALSALPALAGAAVGTLLEPGGGTMAGGALGGGIGDAIVQAREYVRGERESPSYGRLGASTAIGAFVPKPVQAAATPMLTAAKTLGVRGLQGAVMSGLHEAASEAIDERTLDPERIAFATGFGGLLGTGFGGLESSPRLLQAWRSIRGRPETSNVIPAEILAMTEARRAAMTERPQTVPVGRLEPVPEAILQSTADVAPTELREMATAFGEAADATNRARAERHMGTLNPYALRRAQERAAALSQEQPTPAPDAIREQIPEQSVLRPETPQPEQQLGLRRVGAKDRLQEPAGRREAEGILSEGGAARAPEVDVVTAVESMTPHDFSKWALSQEGGATSTAWDTGIKAIGNESEIARLKSAWEKADAAARKALDEGSQDFDALSSMAMKGQFFREAYEAATNTGSAAGAMRVKQAHGGGTGAEMKTPPVDATRAASTPTTETATPLKPPAQMTRPELRAELTAAGITHVGGTPIAEAAPNKLMAEVGRLRSRGNRGFIPVGALASPLVHSGGGAAAGAAIGAATGDTPEERMERAKTGAILGAGTGFGAGLAAKNLLPKKDVTLAIDKHLQPAPKPGLADRARGIPNKIKAATLTRFAPLDKLAADVAKSNKDLVSVLPRAVPLSREFEQVAGAMGKAAQDVRDFKASVLDVAGDSDRQNLDRIMALRRIQQRLEWNKSNASDRKVVGDWDETKVNADLAALERALGPQRFKELDDLAKGPVQQAADEALKLQVQSGRISQEMYDAIKNANDFYAPFKVLDVAERFDSGAGRAIDTREQLAKAITGLHNEEFHIENPSRALAEHIFKARILAEKNRKMLELAKLADADVKGAHIRKLNPGQEGWRGWETVNYYENGVPKQLAVSPEVANAVKGMNAAETGVLANFARFFAAPFRFGATTANLAFQPINFALADQPNLWLVSKYGLKADPKELVKAPSDFVHGLYAAIEGNKAQGSIGAATGATAGYQSADDDAPFKEKLASAAGGALLGYAAGKGAQKLMPASKLYRDFAKSGAAGSHWQEMIDSVGGGVDEKKLMGALDIKEHSILDHIGSINKVIEEASKLMGFRRGLRIEGLDKMTPSQAEEALKKVVTEVRNFSGSPDFQRSGWMVRDMNNLLQMFLNARVQGITNLTGRLAGVDGRKAATDAWIRIGGTVGTGAAYLWFVNHRPENVADFANRSETEKNNYFLYPRYDEQGQPLYGTNEHGERVREYWRIPKREVLQYMGNMVESALDFAAKRDPEGLKDFAVNFMENLSPVNVQGRNLRERVESAISGANPMVKVPYEMVSGRDAFRHSEIVPDFMQKSSPGKQFFPGRTPEPFVKAAHAMPDWAPDAMRSPLMLQKGVEGLTAAGITQFTPRKKLEDRDALASRVESNPVTRRFVGPLYTDRSKEREQLEAAERVSADERVDRYNKANEIIDAIKRGEVGVRDLTALRSIDEKLYDTVISSLNRRIQGPTVSALKDMDAVGRAAYIQQQVAAMGDDEKVAFLTQMARERILTRDVLEQLARQP